MDDPYWFWLTFPGGVVIGLIILSPFFITCAIVALVKKVRYEKKRGEAKAKLKEALDLIRSRYNE